MNGLKRPWSATDSIKIVDLTIDDGEPTSKRQKLFTPIRHGDQYAKPSPTVSSQHPATPRSKSDNRSSASHLSPPQAIKRSPFKNVPSWSMGRSPQSNPKRQHPPHNLDNSIKVQSHTRDEFDNRRILDVSNSAIHATSTANVLVQRPPDSRTNGGVKNGFRMPVAQPIKFKASTPDSSFPPKVFEKNGDLNDGQVVNNVFTKFSTLLAQPIKFDANSTTIKHSQGSSSPTKISSFSPPVNSLKDSQAKKLTKEIQINLPVRASPNPQHVHITANASSAQLPKIPKEVPRPSNIVVNIPPTERKRVRRELIEKLKKGTDFVKSHPVEVEKVLGLTGYSKCFTPIDLNKTKYEKAAQPRKRTVDRESVKLDLIGSSRAKGKQAQSPVIKYEFVHPRDQAKAILTDRFGEKFEPPLTFSNDVNDNRLSGKFQFISNYILRKGVKININLSGAVSCRCQGPGCQIDCICLHKRLDDFMGASDEQVKSYERRSDGLTVLTDSYIEEYATRAEISECNERCQCPPTCTNRVVQRGRTVPLEIFQTLSCGFGVRSSQKLVRGQFIELYLGEVITESELQRREEAKGEGASSYIYSLDWFPFQHHYHIDGEHFGSAMRFVNHSCNPNARVFTVMNHKSTKQLHHVAFFAIQDIPAGTEITIDYCPQEAGNVYEEDELVDEDVAECRCGSTNCRKRLWGRGKERRSRKRLLPRDLD